MIPEKGAWKGYPGNWINGRWVATEYGWNRMRAEHRGKWCEAESHSPFCKRIGVEFHHRYGRGAGKRDDRWVLPDGTVNMLWLSRECHDLAKIERRNARTDQAELTEQVPSQEDGEVRESEGSELCGQIAAMGADR